MQAYAYRKIDAFTAGASLGNPAACLYLTREQELTNAEMQAVAAQHHGFVSEMVFCREADGGYDLAYFSSECEVEFCGHGTIACVYSLIESTPALQNKREITLRTRRKGILTAYNELSAKGAVFISAPEPVYGEVAVSREAICESTGLTPADISENYPLDFIDAGNRTLILPLSSLEREVSLFPDEKTLREFSLANGIDVVLTYCLDTAAPDRFAHTRVFAPKFGYLEDPATGSANSAFGYYMLRHGLWKGESITLEQGGRDRVFNAVKMELRDGALLFGGAATTRIEGKYYI